MSEQNTPAAAPVQQISGNPDTRPANQADMSPQDRFLDVRDGPHRARIGDTELSPEQYDKLQYTEKLEYAARRTELANGNRADPGSPAEPAATGERFKVGKFEVSEAELGKMLERQGAEDLKNSTLPGSPEKYELKISEGATLPGGQQMNFDTSDPGLSAARNWAHAKGLSQGEFSELLTIYASHEAQRANQMAEAQAREIAKIGPNGPQRVDAVNRFVQAQMGDADAKVILRTLVSDAQLRFMEKMITRVTNQSGSDYGGGRREVETQGLTEAQWNSMSYSQRKEYSERASAQTGRGGRR